MKKINRKKSLRIMAATLSFPLMIGLLGCGSKKRVEKSANDYEEKLTILTNNNQEVGKLDKVLSLSKQVDKYLEEDNLLGEKKEINGIEYYDYIIDDSKYNFDVEGYTLDEMEEIANGFKKLSVSDKRYFKEHLNKVIYYNNLYINYDNLYRVILSEATGEEYLSVLDEEEFNLKIKDDKKAILRNKDLADYEVLMNLYNIDEEYAVDLSSLINTMPSVRFMVDEMNSGEYDNFGSEDTIPILNEELRKSLETLNSLSSKYYNKIKEEQRKHNKSKILKINI